MLIRIAVLRLDIFNFISVHEIAIALQLGPNIIGILPKHNLLSYVDRL